jgi:hypothetical protein
MSVDLRKRIVDYTRLRVDVAARSWRLAKRVGDVARRVFNRAQPFVDVA